MSRLSIGVLFTCLVVLVSASATVHAEDKKPAKGFWKILVKPKATWVLHDTIAENDEAKKARIKVETYDVRKVGKADVARLRWTHIWGNDKHDIGGGTSMPTQVAVTSAGLYLLKDTDDDAAIAAVLKKKPHRADPPRAYEATKRNEGRYLTTGADHVCWGETNVTGEECGDICEGMVCLSATKGVTEISGTLSPNKSIWEQ